MTPSGGWTPFPELDRVLALLVEGARAALGPDFAGAYLQGSFAVGDADEHSDVDFLVATRQPVTPAQERSLRTLHAALPGLPSPWARHLEGSYPPVDELRGLTAARRSWLYVDNGAREMEWSDHDDTAVVRWSLRERGVVLSGPAPATLVDEVSAGDLRRQARADAARFLPLLPTWAELDNAWTQPYVVATFCRFLHTLAIGEVTSKAQALRWARDELDPRWRALVDGALADRPDPWERIRHPARPGSVETTLQFARYAEELAQRTPG